MGGHEGAAQIAALLSGRGVKLDYVLDEGLIIAEGVLPVPHPIALVGIAEKGSLSLELSVDGEGGHSSMPPTQTAIGVLGAAVGRLEAHPMSGGIHGVARQTLDHVGSSSARSGRPFPTRSSRRRSSSAPPIRGTTPG